MVRYLFYTIGELTYQSPLVYDHFKGLRKPPEIYITVRIPVSFV